MSVRQWDRFRAPSAEERQEVLDLLPWWRGRSAYDVWERRLPAPLADMFATGFIGGVTFSNNGFYPAHARRPARGGGAAAESARALRRGKR